MSAPLAFESSLAQEGGKSGAGVAVAAEELPNGEVVKVRKEREMNLKQASSSLKKSAYSSRTV
jgi:hypothetical protein